MVEWRQPELSGDLADNQPGWSLQWAYPDMGKRRGGGSGKGDVLETILFGVMQYQVSFQVQGANPKDFELYIKGCDNNPIFNWIPFTKHRNGARWDGM